VLLRAARPRPREPARRAAARDGRSSVLHVITTLRSGGAENMLAQLVEHDQAAGRRQWVAPLVDGGRHRERLRGAGVPVVDLHINGPAGLFGGLMRLVRLIRQARPDVAVGWMYHANLVLAAAIVLAGRRGRTRLIWGLRSSDMDFGRYHPQLRAVARAGAWLSGLPDAIVANSQAGYSFHLRLGYRPRRFYIVDNGVDVARFAPEPRSRALTRQTLGIPDDACVAVMVARVDPMKDHGTFLAALRIATGITALAAGRGTESLPDTPGLARLGERADIPALLAASDVLVLSSAFGEGVPNAVLEGMAAGLAVLATDVGDARRVLGGAGVVVPPRDPGALAAALQRLRDDPVLRQDLGARARTRADALFSIGRAARGFGRLLDSFDTLAPRWSAAPIAAAETADTRR
jgi:glycosyltransferase involved in cell wall biosynthesis